MCALGVPTVPSWRAVQTTREPSSSVGESSLEAASSTVQKEEERARDGSMTIVGRPVAEVTVEKAEMRALHDCNVAIDLLPYILHQTQN